jgi:hypothetical protein
MSGSSDSSVWTTALVLYQDGAMLKIRTMNRKDYIAMRCAPNFQRAIVLERYYDAQARN